MGSIDSLAAGAYRPSRQVSNAFLPRQKANALLSNMGLARQSDRRRDFSKAFFIPNALAPFAEPGKKKRTKAALR